MKLIDSTEEWEETIEHHQWIIEGFIDNWMFQNNFKKHPTEMEGWVELMLEQQALEEWK